MGTQEKLIARFASKPKDFTYAELKRLLNFIDYTEEQASGSRVVFVNKKSGHKIKLHKPHPGNILKSYQIELIVQELKDRKLI
jgi:hypothetical protein